MDVVILVGQESVYICHGIKVTHLSNVVDTLFYCSLGDESDHFHLFSLSNPKKNAGVYILIQGCIFCMEKGKKLRNQQSLKHLFPLLGEKKQEKYVGGEK